MFRGETFADVEKAKARVTRELCVARQAVHDADVDYEVALEDGADDDVMRAALDKKTTTTWAVGRLTKRLAELDRQHIELKKKARVALLARLLNDVAKAADEHGQAAIAAAATARKFVAARGALEAADFRREAAEVEMFPPWVLDYSNSNAANPDVSSYEGLDRWRFSMSALARRLVTSAPTPDAPAPMAPMPVALADAPVTRQARSAGSVLVGLS